MTVRALGRAFCSRSQRHRPDRNVSVMTRRRPVRCGKSRPLVAAGVRVAPLMLHSGETRNSWNDLTESVAAPRQLSVRLQQQKSRRKRIHPAPTRAHSPRRQAPQAQAARAGPGRSMVLSFRRWVPLRTSAPLQPSQKNRVNARLKTGQKRGAGNECAA
jgi:hypothetical protein